MTINYGYKSTDGWVKIYQHKIAGGYWSSANNWEEVLNSNPTDPSANKYSQLYKIENMNEAGVYTLKMVFPEGGVTNIWSQTHNPLLNAPTAATVPGYTAISIQSAANSWGGLSRSDSPTAAFVDGNPLSNNWYYPIGPAQAWNGGIPAYAGTGVPTLELWVKIR